MSNIYHPTLVGLPNGLIAVAWVYYDPANLGASGLYAQMYDASGKVIGEQ